MGALAPAMELPVRNNREHQAHSQKRVLRKIKKMMTDEVRDQLSNKLTELKRDTDPAIFRILSEHRGLYPDHMKIYYERVVEVIVSFFRDHCAPTWYPNNAVKEPLNVSPYRGSRGSKKLKSELICTFASTSVGDSLAAKYRALGDHYAESELANSLGWKGTNHLRGFRVAKFRKWMKTGDKKTNPVNLPRKQFFLTFMM